VEAEPGRGYVLSSLVALRQLANPQLEKQSEEFGTSHSFPLMHWRFDSPGNWLEAKPADEAFTGTQVLWALSA
jgi:hypothetical protein